MGEDKKSREGFEKLIEIVGALRGPNGCPWDKQQTHASLLPYLLEETYEVIESIEDEDWVALREEIGDLLLHVVLQSQIADENGEFNISNVVDDLNKKIINRHPHVFSNEKLRSFKEAKQNWETLKHKEKQRESRLDGVPKTLSALTRSFRLQQKAASTGFDWNNAQEVLLKVDEEIDELKIAIQKHQKDNISEELGDVLFTLVNLGRHLNIHSEDTLRAANNKFIERFKKVEHRLNLKGKDLEDVSTDTMNEIWKKVKIEEQKDKIST